MAQTIYKRQVIGQASGVQINMPVDRTDRMLPQLGDQTLATVGQFSRGRIDKPFLVLSSKLKQKLGVAKSIRLSRSNETYIQIFDAFRTGAAAAVVMRLASKAAVNSWVVLNHGAEDVLTTSEDLPDAGDSKWLMAMKFADCINEGVYVSIAQGATKDWLKVVVRERYYNSKGIEKDQGDVLYEFEGSTDYGAIDEQNNSAFIGDVVEKLYPDMVEIEVSKAPLVAEGDALAKGKIGVGIVAFVDDGTLTNEDYQAAATQLGKTSIPYRYIMSEGEVIVLVSGLVETAQKYNRKMFQEVSGDLSPEAAVAWVENNFEFDAQGGMYCDWIWTPIKRQDPTGVSGVVRLSSVGQKVGYSCARNSITNGHGMSPLNQPVAGKDFYLSGSQFQQTYHPEDEELALLAEAKINPCIYSEYHDGSGYVWEDSLSGAKKSGISKLSSVSEMSIWFQDYLGRYSKSLLQKPMSEALVLMEREIRAVCDRAFASNWLVESVNLGGAPYGYEVFPNDRYPDDQMDWTINLAFDGVVRVIKGSQNMFSRK